MRLESAVPLDRYCCYSSGRISDIIVPCLREVLNIAETDRQRLKGKATDVEGQRQGQGQGVGQGVG
jgi:hypothetical protein